MNENSWDSRLAAAVKKFTKSSDVTTFRNEYHALINGASLHPETLQLLRTGRDYLEAWVADPPPPAEKAFEQWMHLYRNVDRLEWLLLQAFLAKFPRYESGLVDWGAFALDCPRRDFIEAIIAGRRLPDQELAKLVGKHSEKFFRSCLLDILLQQRKLKNLPEIARQCLTAEQRPAGRAQKAQILAYCLANDKAGKAIPHVLDYLSQHPEEHREFFRLVLGHLSSAIAVVERLWPRPEAEGKAKRKGSDVLAAARQAVVAACLAAVESSDPAIARTASLVLAQIRLTEMIHTAGAAGPAESVEAMTREPLRRLVSQWIKAMESQRSAEVDAAVLLRVRELHDLVQEYFSQLPVNLDHSLDSPERAMVVERHRGRKQVIDEIVGLLETPAEGVSLRDRLEDALFNVGVRPLGLLGETTNFQNRYHQGIEPNLIPGDSVVVVKPGRILGDISNGFVLTRAVVRLASSPESTP